MKTKLFFAGDVVLGQGCVKEQMLSKRLADKLQECKIVCCNFEAPLAVGDKKKKIGPNNANVPETIDVLKQAGFNLVTLANNHIFDYGIEGMENTIALLRQRGIHTIGASSVKQEINASYVVESEGKIIGLLNMAENGFGCQVDDTDEYGYSYILGHDVKSRIKSLKECCDVVIVVCHAGAEQWDLPLPEWRQTYKTFIDWGVDVVVAHHPHVPQGWEEYQGGYIFYSLGNFAFDKGKGPVNAETYSVIITLEDGKIAYEIIPTVFRDGIIDINDSSTFRNKLEECCNILRDDMSYINVVNDMCNRNYKEYYRYCYGKVVCDYKGNVKERIKGFVKKYMSRIWFQDIWLYHNINIETHLYICKRATRLILKEKEIL